MKGSVMNQFETNKFISVFLFLNISGLFTRLALGIASSILLSSILVIFPPDIFHILVN
jgi:hypothetical protein